MLIYIAMMALSLPGIFGVFKNSKIDALYFYFTCAIYILFVGLRFQTGADWVSYNNFFEVSKDIALTDALRNYDVGFSFLIWLTSHSGFDFYVVTLVCAFFSVSGVAIFVRKQPCHWLGLYVSVPIYLIPISMAQMRQSVAIGFELMAIVAIINRRKLKTAGLMFSGFLFHKSLLVLTPFAFFFNLPKLNTRIALLFLFCAPVFIYLISFDFSVFVKTYIYNDMYSRGFFYRITLASVSAIILIVYSHRFNIDIQERNLWFAFSIITLTFLGLSLFDIFTSLLDRFSFYLIPLQLFVASRILTLFKIGGDERCILNLLVIFGYAIVGFIWLIYSPQSVDWLPYNTYLE